MSRKSHIGLVRLAWMAVAILVLAATVGPLRPALADVSAVVDAEQLNTVFPGAERAGPFEGEPPAAAVYRDGRVAGYVFSTLETVGTVGFSGKPLDVLAGVDNDGVVTGALLRRHNEPILVIGVSHADLAAYVDAFAGFDLRVRVEDGDAGTESAVAPDAISGATVSSAVIRDGIIRAGRAVARSRGILGGGSTGGARLDRESFSPASWGELREDGSITRLRTTRGDIAERLGSAGPAPEGVEPDATFIDLYVGLLSPPRVGQNLLGKPAFNRITADIGVDDQLVFIAADGLYSFKGTAYVRSGRFDRIQIVQEDKTIALSKDGYHNVEALRAEGAPEFRETGVFVVPAASGFDPLRPWRLDLLVSGEGPSEDTVGTVIPVDYTLPERYRLGDPEAEADEEAAAGQPLWQEIWRERWAKVTIVSLILMALTAILVFQDNVAEDPRLYRRLRLAFLVVTLLWIGWYAGGQLSVVNVLTFSHALMGDFQWEFFLLDPVIFLLWGYVAVALLFWGRGVFCGWLCPFGALQELLSEAARKLKVPQVSVPFTLHERLWPIKYVIFLGLFAVSLHSTNYAFIGAEVEPFKTAISLKFVRHWPFVVYALALLAAGLFIERFFCRYLCPLGAALAIPARLRMFEWLKRRPQCGKECAICGLGCPVQAIHPSGEINPNECIHCLKCQTLYFDPLICPPLVARRKRRERREALSQGKPAIARGGIGEAQ